MRHQSFLEWTYQSINQLDGRPTDCRAEGLTTLILSVHLNAVGAFETFLDQTLPTDGANRCDGPTGFTDGQTLLQIEKRGLIWNVINRRTESQALRSSLPPPPHHPFTPAECLTVPHHLSVSAKKERSTNITHPEKKKSEKRKKNK